MDQIIKICKVHGNLDSSKVFLNKKNIKICRICRENQSRKSKLKNKDILIERAKKRRDDFKSGLEQKTCKKHGKLKFNEINVNCRNQATCKICANESRVNKYYFDKQNRPKTKREILIELKAKGACIKHGENVRYKNGSCKFCHLKTRMKYADKKIRKRKEYYESKKENLGMEFFRLKANKRLQDLKKNTELYEMYKEKVRIRSRKAREELADAYVKIIIRRSTRKNKENRISNGIPIPNELIDLVRKTIELKRLLRDKRYERNT